MTSLPHGLKLPLQNENTPPVATGRRIRDVVVADPAPFSRCSVFKRRWSSLRALRRAAVSPLFVGGSTATLLALALVAACGTSSKSPTTADETTPEDSAETPGDSAETSLASTAWEHAQACAAELGPVPAFDFSSALEIPVTQGGVPVESGEVFDCDLPAAFQSPCERGLLGRIQGTRADGTEDPDVVWIYIVRSGGFAAIGYHGVSGATCFLEIDDLPADPVLAAPADVGAEAYNAQWASPHDMFEVSRCQDCHMADPFLHSPYLDQLQRSDDPTQPMIPVVAGASNPRPPYWIISAAEGPHTTELSGNSCTECHRPQCTTLFDGEADEDEGEATSAYKLDELAMPAPFHDLSTWDDATATADREAVRAWCNSLEPYGPQYDAGGDDGDDEDGDDDGACDQAYECALECGTTDYDCARACGATYLEGASASTFDALLSCGENAGCPVADLECLDTSCGAELGAFIATCEDDD